MGTLEGHLMPGIFFLLYSLYYSVLVSLALLRKQRFLKVPLPPREKRGQKWWQLMSLEGVVKLVCSMFGILGELFYPPGVNRMMIIDWKDPKRPFVFKDNWEHITMYGFFLLTGVVDIVSQSCLARQKIKLERAAEGLAFFILVLLMINHIEDKSVMEIRAHIFFMVPSFLVGLVIIIEIWVPDQPSLWVLKTWMVLVVSNWMLQMAILMYTPPTRQPWQSDNINDLAFLSIFFCWHVALGAAILAAVYGLCSLWYHRYSSCIEVSFTRYQPCPMDPRSEEIEKFTTSAVLQDGVV